MSIFETICFVFTWCIVLTAICSGILVYICMFFRLGVHELVEHHRRKRGKK